MAVSLLGQEVRNLCIGKPALTRLLVTATVSDALAALKRCRETFLGVWSCDAEPRCVAKISLSNAVCFLTEPRNLQNPGLALLSPLSALISKLPRLIRHVKPKASLSEALDLILDGAQNLVIPFENSATASREKRLQPSLNGILRDGREYCWLTQEDIIRFILNSISFFNPTSTQPINALRIIETDNVLAVRCDNPASNAVPSIAESIVAQTSVAIIDTDCKLIGEISPSMINSCNETVAAAIATLSSGDLMAYVDYGGPPESLARIVRERLEERNMRALLELMDDDESGVSSSSNSSSSSSDEECRGRSHTGSSSSRAMRGSEVIVCHPWSSLTATMIQALSHRVGYIWVIEENGTLAGIVTFAGMLKVFRERMKSMA